MEIKQPINLTTKQEDSFIKESEDEFRMLVNGIKDYAIFMLDAEGYITTWNEGAKQMKGYDEHEILKKHFSIFYPPEDVIQNKPFSQLELAKEKGSHEDEGWRVKKNGTLFWANVLITAIYNEDGTLHGFAKVTRDITTQKKLQEENKLLTEKLHKKVIDLEKSEASLSAIIENAEGLEKAFRSEQERFTDLFLQAPVSICILKGENHIYEMANPVYIQTFGKEDIIGKTVKQVFPEIEDQGFLQLLNDVYKTGKSFSGSETLVKIDRYGDGRMSNVFVNFIYQAYRNREGIIEGIFFFGTDVTEQVQARKKIEESEKKYGNLIQNLPAAIYTSDAEGRILLYNKAAANLWGNEPEIGKDSWCKDCKTYKADGTLLPYDSSPMALTLFERRPIFGEEIIIESTAENKSHVLPYSAPVYDFYGNLTGAINMLIEITDRKRAERELKISNERFEIVIKATNDAIWEWNLVTGDVYHNSSYERIFGYEVDAAAQNIEQWIEKIHIEDRDRVKGSIMQKITDADTATWQEEYRYIKSNGEIADVFDRGFIIVDNENKPIRFVGAMQDITERKKSEIEKEYLIEQLTTSYQDLQQFTYITSHNLRAPLSNLIGLINNIDFDSLNDFNKEIIEMFRKSTQQLHQTINDLNQVLIIKNNKKLEIQKIYIDEVLKNVCTYFKDDIEKLPVSIHTDFRCEELPFNKSYLESVLTNLISNSIKYRSPTRPLQLNITTKKEHKGYVSLTFKDNGIGIDLKRNKDKMFGLYQRFHSNTSGQGFGLFITKTQITSFGGTVDVESEVDKGTTFYIVLREKL